MYTKERILQVRLSTLEIILSEKLKSFSARTIQKLYFQIMHDSIDYHEFSIYLDELHNKGIVKVTGHNTDGMTQYSLK